MPTYEYECKECLHRFEAFQSMTEPHLKRCPKCQGDLRRLIGLGSGIIFKGSGFYATDYRKKTASIEKENKKKEKNNGSTGDSKCSSCVSKNCSSCS